MSTDLDIARDDIQCLFRNHDDLLESLYQVATPAVHNIFSTMSKQASLQTDSEDSLAALMEDGLSKTADWNRYMMY